MMIEARFQIRWESFELNINTAFPANGVTAVFGPSGCGKTTFLRAIAGLEISHGGFLKVGDQVWQQGDFFLPPHKRSLGYVFQETSLFTHLNVRQNIEYGLKRLRNGRSRISMGQILDLLDIGHLLTRDTTSLSGGEQKRVAIARALAANPSIVLLDEPMAALDDERKAEILPYLKKMNQELDIPVLFVSHSQDEVTRLADMVLLLDKGKVKRQGKVGEIFNIISPQANNGIANNGITEKLVSLTYLASEIEALVVSHDTLNKMNQLKFRDGELKVFRKSLEIGTQVRVAIPADDVYIYLSFPGKCSHVNVLPATVEKIIENEKGMVLVYLNIGDTVIYSIIESFAYEMIKIKCGDRVFLEVNTANIKILPGKNMQKKNRLKNN